MTNKQRDDLLISLSKNLVNLQEIIIENNKEHKKDIERLETKIDNVETNLRREMNEKMDSLEANLRREMKEMETNIRKDMKENIDRIDSHIEKIDSHIEDIDSNINAIPVLIKDVYNYEERDVRNINQRVENCENDITELKKKLA